MSSGWTPKKNKKLVPTVQSMFQGSSYYMYGSGVNYQYDAFSIISYLFMKKSYSKNYCGMSTTVDLYLNRSWYWSLNLYTLSDMKQKNGALSSFSVSPSLNYSFMKDTLMMSCYLSSSYLVKDNQNPAWSFYLGVYAGI